MKSFAWFWNVEISSGANEKYDIMKRRRMPRRKYVSCFARDKENGCKIMV
jgi:hypothetical protein